MRFVCVLALLISSLVCSSLMFPTSAFSLEGGDYVPQDRFPGSIAFFLPKTATQERCTATHVAKFIFLTAAHCFDRYEQDGANPLIIFVANQMGPDKQTHVIQFERKLVRAPVIQPDYYRSDAWFAAFRNKTWGNNPDLALIKINEDIEELGVANVSESDFHVGQTLLIGGFGPALAGKECTPTPCSIRMSASKVTSLTSREVLLASNEVFLTGGDSGGPAYEVRDGKPYVVAVNQGCDNLSNPNAGKVSRLTKIDYSWYHANLVRLEEGRK